MADKEIVFLASGGGGTLRFLHKALDCVGLSLHIQGVVADRRCPALQYAEKAGMRVSEMPYTRRCDAGLNAILAEWNPDCVITNIHKILSPDTLSCCGAKFINLHYSILPAYTGYIGMDDIIGEAQAQSVKFLGATCHDVSAEVDAGNIICQGAFGVDWREERHLICNRLFRCACLVFLNALMLRFAYKQGCYRHPDCLVNPSLVFDPGFATEDFWNEVAGS